MREAVAIPGRAWVPEFLALGAVWGASFLFMRWSVVEFGVWATALLRVGIGALVLVPLLLLHGLLPQLRSHLGRTMAVGVVNSALPFALYSYALLSISTGLSAILNATVPLFGALVAWAWLHERPGRWRVLGLFIGFAGVVALAWEKVHGRADTLAVLACLAATLCYGIAASATRRYLQGVPSLVSATGSLLGASLALAPLALWHWPTQAASVQAWAAVASLGLLCTGVAYVMYFRLIERAGASRTLTVTFAIPVFAMVYGVVLLGEHVSAWMLGCALVVLLGTALSSGVLVPPLRRG